MGESEKHNSLVLLITKWIEYNKGSTDNIFLLIDSGLSPAGKKTKKIEGYVPDVFAEKLSWQKWTVIGEAKTAKDLDSKRSEEQIKSFINFCSKTENASFVLAVPWEVTFYAKALLNQFKKQLETEEVDIIVINEFKYLGR